MRWKAKEKPKIESEIEETANLGDIRECVIFALFPVRTDKRWIWLEKVKEIQIFTRRYGDCGFWDYFWTTERYESL